MNILARVLTKQTCLSTRINVTAINIQYTAIYAYSNAFVNTNSIKNKTKYPNEEYVRSRARPALNPKTVSKRRTKAYQYSNCGRFITLRSETYETPTLFHSERCSFVYRRPKSINTKARNGK